MKKVDVLNLRKKLQDDYKKRVEAIDLVLQMLGEGEDSPNQNHSPTSESTPLESGQKRTRGLLTAVRAVLPKMPEQFTKFEIIDGLKNDFAEIASKMKPESLRGSLAALQGEGEIVLIRESAGTKPAVYSRSVKASDTASNSEQVAA